MLVSHLTLLHSRLSNTKAYNKVTYVPSRLQHIRHVRMEMKSTPIKIGMSTNNQSFVKLGLLVS